MTDKEKAKIVKEFFQDDEISALEDDELRAAIVFIIGNTMEWYSDEGVEADMHEALKDVTSLFVRYIAMIFEAERRGSQRIDTIKQLEDLFNK